MHYNPLVSIIIPTYHDWERLSKCINALENQTYGSDMYEVIIVNNDLMDAVPDNFYNINNLQIITEQKSGSYAARNAGLSIANGEIIGFTDSDCIPALNWIEAAVNFFRDNPDVDRVGGRVDLFIAGDKPTLAEAYEIVYAFKQEDNIKLGVSVTANMFAKKRVFDSIGLFNPDVYSGGDFEWGLRAASHNFKICFSQNVIVKHPARGDLKQLIGKIRRVAAGKLLLEPKKSNWIFKFLYFIYEFRPPVNEFKHIRTRGKSLSLEFKFQVFLLRYCIRILRGYEVLKLYNGAKPFKGN
ncbi:glycosyltransferase [Pontibacter vulgaris]|uniref:glycosyltransferase n=1 Tax=Pontibacter vulgaris TaxID=2905679 RepID=UPI001FA72870|nr:glycosyltransferase [Pontibacter vulgaris]